jgi:hypothetical protein
VVLWVASGLIILQQMNTTKGVGWIDKGIENIYGYEPTKGKRVTRELDDTYELEKTSRRGTKTKKISKKRGERFLKQTAKKATRNESEKGKARDKKKTMRIMKRKSSAYGLKKLATKRRVKRNK